MKKITRYIFLIITIIALATPSAAFAQDVEPTPEVPAEEQVTEVVEATTEEPVQDPTEVVIEAPTEVLTEAAAEVPAETLAPTDPPLTETEMVEPTEVVTEIPTEVPTEEEIIAGVVEALAEEEAVLLDENGNPISLATVAAEEALTAADPWFVDGTTLYVYMPGTDGCETYSYPAEAPAGLTVDCQDASDGITNPIQAAINDTHSTDKTIHLTGEFTNETINITKNLTLDGGGTTTIKAPASFTSDFSTGGDDYYGLIYVSNNSTVTIQNLTLDGSAASISGTNDAYLAGILARNAHVTLLNSIISGFSDSRSNQIGVGVLAYSSGSEVTEVTLNQNTITLNEIGLWGNNDADTWVEGTYNNFYGNTTNSLDFYYGRVTDNFWGINPNHPDYFGTPRQDTGLRYFYYDFDGDGTNDDGEQVYYLFLDCEDNFYETIGTPPCEFNGTVFTTLPTFYTGTYTSKYSKNNYDRFATDAKLGDIEPYEVWPFLTQESCPEGTVLIGEECVVPCSYDPTMAASDESCTPCSYDPTMAASDVGCVPCSYDPTMAASDTNCVPCSYNPTMAASDTNCVPCSYDPTMAASDAGCVPCSYDPTMAASDTNCVPCSYDPTLAASDEECGPCSYDPTMAASDEGCVPCSYDDSMAASDEGCVPCSYDDSMAASDEGCVPCSYDPTIAASDEGCVPCSYDDSMAASDEGCVPCSYDDSMAASDEGCVPCSYDPTIAASDEGCVPCSYDDSMAASDEGCVPCSYDDSMAASDEGCVPCSYDPTIAASDAGCVPCVFNPQIGATNPDCPSPCVFNPDIPASDPACPAPCVYNAAIPSTDPACVPPPPPPPPAVPTIGIPVTGGVGGLIPVTGGTLIVSGLGHSCMTYNNGRVICWGLNESGQLGDGTTANQLKPVYVSDIDNALNLTAGSKHTCVLTIDGEVWCWGENGSGQLGNGSTTDSPVPVKVSGLPAKVLNFTAGEEFTCAELANQEVWCWGKNSAGQLNDGTTKNQISPVKTKLTSLFAQFSGGQGFLLGGDVLGSVNTWAKVQATAVKEVTNSLSLSANRWGATGCAVIADGSVKCWGRDLVSTTVAGAAAAMEVGAGLSHNCTINNDQTVSCWGANGNGELGNGLNTASPSATLVKNMQLARALAVGANHTCVLAGANNAAMCWGDNTYGQLGNNSTKDSNVPVLVILPE